ncbi:MAG TPA: hypothetical protein VN923_05410, partial [Thermoanaerobaculia bacterium]|nr:hypothetical protein [Thermoanaerobaculia bacterium]
MTTRLVVLALAWLVPAAAAAQHFHHHIAAAPEDDKRVSVCAKKYDSPDIDTTLPPVPWHVDTVNETARHHFQQGMALYYGFDYEGALRHFKKATDLDKFFVMGWWGRALAAGPNINFLDIDDDCRFAAQAWADRAWSLAQKWTPQHVEYQLAKAILLRYSDDKKILTDEYAVAMHDIWKMVEKEAQPDIGALYAESLMDKWPWDLWNPDHTPKHDDTLVVRDLLRAVIAKHPEAVGANHYFIHAVEGGPTPEEAKPSADFLKKKAGNSGHLRHMPSHTYLLMGDYAAAVDANERATFVDTELFAGPCKGNYKDYVDAPKCRQVYFGHYHAHDLFFRSVAESFLGKIGASRQHAKEARAHVQRFVVNEPGLQRYMAAPYQVLAAWGAWDAIIDGETEPPEDCYRQSPFTQPTGCRILRSMYRWARGMAYTSTTPKRQADVKAAKQELALFRVERDLIKPP